MRVSDEPHRDSSNVTRSSIVRSSMPRSSVARRSIYAPKQSSFLADSKFGQLFTNYSSICHRIAESPIFQVFMGFLVLVSIYLDSIMDIIDTASTAQDDIFLILFIFFILEMLILSLAYRKKYLFSMYFIVDAVSIGMLTPEISYFTSQTTSYLSITDVSTTGVFYIRAARFAVLGARIGREISLMRWIRWIPGILYDQNMKYGSAQSVVEKFNYDLGQRTSFFALVLAVIIPLFYSSIIDQSVVAFSKGFITITTLDESQFVTEFEYSVEDMNEYYADKLYHPVYVKVDVDRYTQVYSHTFQSSYPAREENTLIYYSYEENHQASFECMMDFTDWRIQLAWYSIGSKTLVIFVMILSTLFVSNLVAIQVFLPLDRLLIQLKVMADNLFGNTSGNSKKEEIADDENVIENTIKQIQKFAETSAAKKVVSETKGLDREDLGILNMIQDIKQQGDDNGSSYKANTVTSVHFEGGLAGGAMMDEIDPKLVEAIDTWELCSLELNEASQFQVLSYIFFESKQSLAVKGFVKREKFMKFATSLQSRYLKTNPYHTWEHALDVTHCIYRYLDLINADGFLKLTDRFALLFAALSHDAGHLGVNNQFLVEIQDELAYKYNDKSPLENMHCSVFFEICRDAETNVLSDLALDQFKDVRKLIIEAILKTDNSQHFQMVKDMSILYQSNQAIIDEQDISCKELFKKNDNRLLLCNTLLHQADISNTAKPWEICQKWTALVMEEFFRQGDKEKQLGIPVQMLNDREKVNIPNSQIGFIEFIVSPLFVSTLAVFPGLKDTSELVVTNLQKWIRTWEEKSNPSEEEKAKMKKSFANAVGKYENRIDFVIESA
jgi:3'5'-cyclic nucleotide phosphodiesterase